ncbi:MAG: lactonase family protein, partial [Bacteroidota bacterium]
SIPLYIGTYTRKEGHVDGKALGIYRAVMNQEDGSLNIEASTDSIINPSFVLPSRDGKNLYAVSEIGKGEVVAYAKGDHQLTRLNTVPTGAPAPCHLAMDLTDRYLVTSNYMGGIVNVYRRGVDGQLNEVQRIILNQTEDEKESHAHSATFSPDNRFVLIADLGKDRIWQYQFDASSGKITPNEKAYVEVADGAGPRHFTFHPQGTFAYVINELNSTVTAYEFDSLVGQLTEIQTLSTLPKDFDDNNSCADIHPHPNGKFLYGSNRGHNSIVVYAIMDDGKLSIVEHISTGGDFPRNFALSPDGRFLYAANQNSDNIRQFLINENDGRLTFHADVAVKTPVCLAFAN